MHYPKAHENKVLVEVLYAIYEDYVVVFANHVCFSIQALTFPNINTSKKKASSDYLLANWKRKLKGCVNYLGGI